MKLCSANPKFSDELPMNLQSAYPELEVVDVATSSSELRPGCLGIGKGLSSSEVIDLLLQNRVHHLVQLGGVDFAQDFEVSAKLLQRPSVFLEKGLNFFGLKFNQFMSYPFSPETDKDQLMKHAEKFVSVCTNSNVRESAQAVIEELYMNALLSAPREAKRRGFRQDHYGENQEAHISLGLTDQHLMIACDDPIGSLDVVKLLYRMAEVYREGAGEVINFDKAGGAGLGCVIMFEHTSNLILGVIPEKVSMVVGMIPLGLSYRERAQLGKSIAVVSGLPLKGNLPPQEKAT